MILKCLLYTLTNLSKHLSILLLHLLLWTN